MMFLKKVPSAFKDTRTRIASALIITTISPLVAFLLYLYVPSTARPASFLDIKTAYRPSDMLLYDRRGEVIDALRVDFEKRRLAWTPLQDISPALIKAVVNSEDKRYYAHGGVDWSATASAAFNSLARRHTRGASTITMQLAALLGNGGHSTGFARKTVGQKLAQMRAAIQIEGRWTKTEILETYLNLVTYRGELEGVAAAAQGLFNRTPDALDEAQSRVLAALIRSPNAPAKTVTRRACGIEPQNDDSPCAEIESLVQKSLSIPYSIKRAANLAPHVAQKLLKFGRPSALSTLDGRLQFFAAETLKRHVQALGDKNVRDGAVLVVDNVTGEVLAYVSNTQENASARYVDGVDSFRQAGSTLKPFLYATALDSKLLTSASLLNDAPLDVPTEKGTYRPRNYDNSYRGLVPLRVALASSLNVTAVRTVALLGPEAFVSKLRELGFRQLKDADHYGLSIALGTADVTLSDLVNAYRTLANRGLWNPLKFEPDTETGAPKRVFSEGAAFIISDILSDREARGAAFGLENPLTTKFHSAVKTGTSKNMRDNWCVGFSDSYTVGVWVGNLTGEPMYNVSGISGAAPVWFDVMNYLHGDSSSAGQRVAAIAADVIEKTVIYKDSGIKVKEYFIKGTEDEIVRRADRAAPPKIIYPPDGAVIALDPDIPNERQKMYFEADAWDNSFRWKLDGKAIGGPGRTLMWTPRPGRHTLSIVDKTGKVLDHISFIVKK
jgi:penicillin-binding protein 1C